MFGNIAGKRENAEPQPLKFFPLFHIIFQSYQYRNHHSTLSLPKQLILDSSKLIEFADNNFKCINASIFSCNNPYIRCLETLWEREKMLNPSP